MAELAIKGHKTRGKEVIEILEMLGGRSILCTSCYYDTEMHYYIASSGYITAFSATDYIGLNMTVFTVEQFLEKYPYKVGDKVFVKTAGESIVITNMYWCNVSGQVIYGGESNTREYDNICVSQIQPYAEQEQETMEETKKDLDWHPTDYLEFVDNDEWADEVELNLGNSYKIQVRGGKTYAVKKQPQYPKTYKECCDILGISTIDNDAQGYKGDLIIRFQELLIARDAYWKIAGNWKPDWKDDITEKYIIYVTNNDAELAASYAENYILAFPTEEMRDDFYKNFKDLIELCKELL